MAKPKKTKKAAKPASVEVTACSAAPLGADGYPPLDRPEWLVEATSEAVISGALAALVAPLKVPKAKFLDITVGGVDVRLIVLPAYKTDKGDWNARLEAWKQQLQPLVAARETRLAGGIMLTQIPKNLHPPGDEAASVSGWLRYLSKSPPDTHYMDPRGYVNVWTAKQEFPEGAFRGRNWWTTYDAFRLVIENPARGRNEIWRRVVEVARALNP